MWWILSDNQLKNITIAPPLRISENKLNPGGHFSIPIPAVELCLEQHIKTVTTISEAFC